ncbi:MAG: response regulator receiver protein [Polyangiaceae bacterium]|jgi:two-component system cell cycle response regulator DivK|nr:response regulator receiver protein [Polyangiaceae bacterium]
MTRTALLIEDNELNRYLATFLLTQHGYHVVPAANGQAALGALGDWVPDVILLDIQLPGMDGYEVARLLRKLDSLRSTPIIAVTSYAMVGDREKSMEAGCNGYIEKPINPETFIREIEEVRIRKDEEIHEAGLDRRG